MSHEWALARAFVGVGGTGRVHSSFLVSMVGVLLGVAFLVLTLSIYDSYVAKHEAIVFALYPPVLLFDRDALPAEPEGDAPTADTKGDKDIGPEDAICHRICQGETVLGAERWSVATPGPQLPMSRVVELRRAVAAAEPSAETGVVVAPVILELAELRLPPAGPEGGAVAAAAPRTVQVLGLDPTAQPLVPRVDLILDAGQIDSLRNVPGAVVLADTLWRDVAADGAGHDRTHLRVLRDHGSPLDLPLAGRFELGFHAISHQLLITSVTTAQALLDLDDQASYVGVGLDDPYRARRVVETLRPAFDRASFLATDWTVIAGGDFESIRLFRWILFLVLGLSFLITALGIRNALAILTLERRRQIGILRALGSRDRSLRAIFLTIACGIGLVGSLPGMVLGSWAGVHFGRWLDRELAGILPIHGVQMASQPMVLAQVLALVLAVCAVTSMVAVSQALSLDTVACLRED